MKLKFRRFWTAILVFALSGNMAVALERVVFATDWKAQAEQGGWRKQPGAWDLSAVYSLSRCPVGEADHPIIERQRLGPADSFSRLTGQGVASRLFASGLLQRHTSWTAGLAERVPVYELSYPSGREFLPAIREFLLATV